MLRKTVLVAAVFVVLFSSNLYAQSVSLGLKVGTLGVGAEVEGNIKDTVGARVGINYLKYNYSGDCGCDVDLDYEIKSTTFPVLLDWHPMSGSFRISGGVVFSNSKFEGSVSYAGTDNDTETVGDNKYRKGDIGSLDATIDFRKTNPYLGLGWDTSFGKNKSFGFLCDLGVVFQGKPDVELTSSGGSATLHADPTFQNDVAEAEEKMQDKMDKWKYYPLIALGMSYRF